MSSEVTWVGRKREFEDFTTMAVMRKAEKKTNKNIGNMYLGPPVPPFRIALGLSTLFIESSSFSTYYEDSYCYTGL
jgi:hypothetical protein